MAITQKDIAERARVSRSLVAQVLSGDETTRVSPPKRQLILSTARDLGYRPNLIARNLRRGKTHTVIAICQCDTGGNTGHFMGGVLEALAIELTQIGYDLKVRFFQDMSSIVATIEEITSASECDALVLWLTEENGEQPGIALQMRGMPFVISGHYRNHADWHQVDYDHDRMMRAAVQHLADSGRTRLAYLGFESDKRFVQRLRSGYQASVQEIFGTPAADDWIYQVGGDPWKAAAVVSAWRELPSAAQPDGIVVGAGTDAWVGIEIALATQSRRIGPGPEDISVVGQYPANQPLLCGEAYAFDNIDSGRLARLAAQDLKRQLRGEDSQPCVTQVLPALVPIPSLRLPLHITLSPEPADGPSPMRQTLPGA